MLSEGTNFLEPEQAIQTTQRGVKERESAREIRGRRKQEKRAKRASGKMETHIQREN